MKTPNLKLLSAFLFCLAYSSYGQPFPPQPQPRAIPPVGAPVPIDEEIWILIVGGIFLGIFFLLRKLKSPA